MTSTDEFDLALTCCRWCYSCEGEEEIIRLARRIEWDRFLHVIERHRVQGLVAHAFATVRISPPRPAHRAIAGEAALITKRNLGFVRECFRLLDKFTAAGEPLMFVKGLGSGPIKGIHKRAVI